MTKAADGIRRRAPRVPTHLEGVLTGRVSRPVSVVDMSVTGCLVRCDAALDRGAILDLRVSLGDEALGCKVRVSEASLDGAAVDGPSPRFLVGLAFLGLSAREESRLRRFLDEQRRRGGADASAD